MRLYVRRKARVKIQNCHIAFSRHALIMYQNLFSIFKNICAPKVSAHAFVAYKKAKNTFLSVILRRVKFSVSKCFLFVVKRRGKAFCDACIAANASPLQNCICRARASPPNRPGRRKRNPTPKNRQRHPVKPNHRRSQPPRVPGQIKKSPRCSTALAIFFRFWARTVSKSSRINARRM